VGAAWALGLGWVSELLCSIWLTWRVWRRLTAPEPGQAVHPVASGPVDARESTAG
ncbi:lipopolysaccharide biosynthesis protein, partial [Corallococcus aberystwythensis]